MSQPIAIGTVLEVQNRYDGVAKYIAAEYNEQGYLKMTKDGQPNTSVTIHPGHAARIAEKGRDSGIKVLSVVDLNGIIVKMTGAVAAAPAAQPAAEAGNGSKKARALALKAANPTATRKELITMFVEQLGMTPAGASTYASMKG